MKRATKLMPITRAQRATEHGKLRLRGVVFTLSGVTVTIADGPTMHPSGIAVVYTIASAVRGGMALQLDNPYIFVNPPMALRRTTTGEAEGAADDVAGAARRMIVDTLISEAKRRE